MQETLKIARALGDENRLRIVAALQKGDEREVCVCRFVEFLRLAPSTVSKHVSLLKEAGLLRSQKRGRWVYYSLPGREAGPAVRGALKWLSASFKEDEPQLGIHRFNKILKMDPEHLCRKQNRGGENQK